MNGSKTKGRAKKIACKLYYEAAGSTWLLGTFKNRQKAEEHWNWIKEILRSKVGYVEPIYVETGKERKKHER